MIIVWYFSCKVGKNSPKNQLNIFIKEKHYSQSSTKNKIDEQEQLKENPSLTISIFSIGKSKTLCLHLIICCYQWINLYFCYYGLTMSIIAMNLPDENRYIIFILVIASEIPGILIALTLLNQMNRRTLLFGCFSLTAISIITTKWIPRENSTIALWFFMLSITCIIHFHWCGWFLGIHFFFKLKWN